jgi:UDP:flavonoid glycosyltransferase YjiC (YdhE family)
MTPHRFLFANWQGGGNVPPALALAKRLARRGHDVRLLGPPSLAAKAAADYAFVGGKNRPPSV